MTDGRTDATTVTSLRVRNRATVLQHIVLARRTTRADIARDCGLSAASAANIVADLIGEGLVHENGTRSSQGGRPIAVIEPRPDGASAIGADIGERGVAVELFDFAMNRIDTEFRGGQAEEDIDAITRDLRDAIAAIRERNPEVCSNLVGIGLGLPGVVETDESGKQTLYAKSNGWPPIAVDELLAVDVPVFGQNGAQALAQAEVWFGAARGVEYAVVALLGRGVGAGIVLEGRLTRGPHSSATEWGHTKIERHGRLCRCGNTGCVEAYLGAGSILDAWREAGGEFEGTGWGALGRLFELARDGDAVAERVVDDVIDSLGTALGSLVNLDNPERVVIGGWVGIRMLEFIGDRLVDAIRRNSLDRPGQQFELVGSTFGGDAVALGSAIAPFEELIQRARPQRDEPLEALTDSAGAPGSGAMMS